MPDQVQGTDDAVTRARAAVWEIMLTACEEYHDDGDDPPCDCAARLTRFEAAVRDAVLIEQPCSEAHPYDAGYVDCPTYARLQSSDADRARVMRCPPCAARERARMAAV